MEELLNLYKHACLTCEYGTNVKQHYDNHMKSDRHIKNVSNAESTEYKHQCPNCHKKYRFYRSFCHHRSKCQAQILHYNKLNPNTNIAIDSELLRDVMENYVRSTSQPEQTSYVVNNTNISLQALNTKCNHVVDLADIITSMRLEKMSYGKMYDNPYLYSKILIEKISYIMRYYKPEDRPIHCVVDSSYNKVIYYYTNKEWRCQTLDAIVRQCVRYAEGESMPQNSFLDVVIKWDKAMERSMDKIYQGNESYNAIKCRFVKTKNKGSHKSILVDGIFDNMSQSTDVSFLTIKTID
jgi:hypothetical protein